MPRLLARTRVFCWVSFIGERERSAAFVLTRRAACHTVALYLPPQLLGAPPVFFEWEASPVFFETRSASSGLLNDAPGRVIRSSVIDTHCSEE